MINSYMKSEVTAENVLYNNKTKKIQSIPEAFVWSGELLLTEEVTRLTLKTKQNKQNKKPQ